MAATASGHRRSCSTTGRVPLKWADLLECSSDEDFSDGEQDFMASVPLSADDSYREAPVAALEDSRSSLNCRVAGLARPHSEAHQDNLTAATPTDFNFLFERLRPAEPASAREDCSHLNADAPEFIPTLSHDCPVIGFCEIPENCTSVSSAPGRLHSPRSSRPRVISSGDSVFECATPTKDNYRSALKQPRSSTKKYGGTRKRLGSASMAVKAPEVKRSRSEEREFEKKARSHRKAHMEMPELTQEEWENRRATRQRAIEFGKATSEYARYSEVRMHGEGEASGLATPDPLDRSISKRQWKYIVQQWRTKLKQLYGPQTDGGDTGSTASADEGLSSITGITDEADANSADARSTTYGDDV